MTPIEQFEDGGAKAVVFAKNQPEYAPLPALLYPDGRVRIEWALSEDERQAITRGENIVLWQWTNGALQPVAMSIMNEHQS